MDIRYAVAGDPIGHSLSPLLAALTAAHFKQAGLSVNISENCLLQCDDVTVPMAWAWAGSGRKKPGVPSRLFGDLSRERNQLKLEKVISEVIDTISTAESNFVPNGESLLFEDADRIKTRRGVTETWISLTAPLKHQLSIRSGVACIDDGLQNGSINQLRWDGVNWHCAGTDGAGLVAVAIHFGFDFDATGVELPLLCLTGGGGAARSCAAEWATMGGQIWFKGGRRALDSRGPWVDSLVEGEDVAKMIGPRLYINFDESSVLDSDADLHVNSRYELASPEIMVNSTESGLRLNGRWLLAAQHLIAWARLFSPEAAHLIPGLGLTMTRLQLAESLLR